MEVLLVLLILSLVPFLFGAFMTFDKLVRMLYEENRGAWVDSGRPRGFFYKPEELGWFGGRIAFHKASLDWVFRTPDWAKDDDAALKLLSRLRLQVLVWNVGMIVFFAIFILTGAIL